MNSSEQVVVRAIQFARWHVRGPFDRVKAESLRETLELSGAFERAEIQPAAEVCLVCGWRTEEGHDEAVHATS